MNYLADLMNLADPVNLIGLAILMIWVNLADETNLANLVDLVYLVDLLVLVIPVILLNLVNMVTLLVFVNVLDMVYLVSGSGVPGQSDHSGYFVCNGKFGESFDIGDSG